MPYTETHEITIGPLNLPDGVKVTTLNVGGPLSVTIAATASSRDEAVALMQSAFALLMTAASAEGVGAPVFVAPEMKTQPGPVLVP